MTQDVKQWLEEVKRLQQQLAQVESDREAALVSAGQWRQLYNTEAQQRRQEAQKSQAAITKLQTQIEQLQNYYASYSNDGVPPQVWQAKISQMDNLDALKKELLAVTLERDKIRLEVNQLTQDLQQEKNQHLETRKNLTTALADTMDLLNKAQSTPHVNAEVVPDLMTNLNLRSINSGAYKTGEFKAKSDNFQPQLPHL